jgi:molybdopterin-binding protein
MKIGARNILKGKIVEITKGATTAHVRIDVAGKVVTSSITMRRLTTSSSRWADRLCGGEGFGCHDRG